MKMAKKGYHKCQGCGEFREDVVECIEPYYEDIHGVESKVKYCSDCYHNSKMDI